MNREESRVFFRRKNERRRLVTDPHQRRENRLMGQLLSMRCYNKVKQEEQTKRRKEST